MLDGNSRAFWSMQKFWYFVPNALWVLESKQKTLLQIVNIHLKVREVRHLPMEDHSN